jgi:hypothetical protein
MAVTLNASTSSGLVQSADTSGEINLQSNGTTKLSVLSTGVSGTLVQGTAVASTSATSINFTAIPSWVKRVTVNLSGVSTNGTSNYLIQIGSGSITSSGYASQSGLINTGGGASGANSTAGFISHGVEAASTRNGTFLITLLNENTYTCFGNVANIGTDGVVMTGGSVTLGGALDRVRITTVNGTDTFDAGTINIQYEG